MPAPERRESRRRSAAESSRKERGSNDEQPAVQSEDGDLLERIDALLKTQGDPAQRLFRAFVEMRDDEWAALRRFIHRLAASDPGAVDFQAEGR